ncbi:18110_t:CDS:2, partial [Acaulospora morrowiae]
MDMTQAKIEQVSRSIELLHIHTVDDLCQKDGNMVKETVEQTTKADMTRANENNEFKEIVKLMLGAIFWEGDVLQNNAEKEYTYAKISAKLSRTSLQIKNFCYPGETRPRPKARFNKIAIESLLSSQEIHDHHANDKTVIGMLAEQRTHDDH